MDDLGKILTHLEATKRAKIIISFVKAVNEGSLLEIANNVPDLNQLPWWKSLNPEEQLTLLKTAGANWLFAFSENEFLDKE